ncbi:YheU family protein [Marinagarivorans cellulosilyticus]|uniref:YheU family protein n=1 Tax=Marinagarivorans cellulosilyticus TaxID=2721545 RepID=A0AAN2BKW5_9GAMM|nr:YheU family protein [Marinagarivorans cellulosilyticus]BCD98464.1 hypothetical protein MARGE09_P2665 [Marinagarivorans cellulosilyticus]
MIIPPSKLDNDVLNNILEEFITREGTDYGLEELNLHEKVERLRPQIMNSEVLIVFDDKLQNIQLISKQDYTLE